MPVPFRDLREEDSLGLAGYLRFVNEQNGRGVRGALFLVNARGEPVDFAFSRIDIPASFLWRAGEARRHAVASLAATLFQACPKTPSVLVAHADEVHPRLFTEDIAVAVPLCRIAERDTVPLAPEESPEVLSSALHLFWVGQPPNDDSRARQLLNSLQSRELLTEPFERASRGIEEAFRE
jgi:hypothetical protein